MNKYRVTIDMNWSQEIKVSAKTEREAKKKAWENFIKKNPTKKNFTIWVDKQ